MLSLKSKICTIVSLILLIICVTVAISYFFIGYEGLNTIFFTIPAPYFFWILGGISLVFATKIHFKILKWLVIILHFICIYSFLYPDTWYEWLIGVGICLGIIELLSRRVKKKSLRIIALAIPMIISIGILLMIIYWLVFGKNEERIGIIGGSILMIPPGLVGLYLSTKLEVGRTRWLLLGLNYFFATFYIIAFTI